MSILIKIGVDKGMKEKFRLNIRKTLDGNFIIFDHPDIDIVVIPEKRKILVLANDSLNTSSKTYDIQNKLFKFLIKKGIVDPETIHAGHVYGSVEGIYPQIKDSGEGITSTDLVLLSISKWVEEERPEWVEEKEIEQTEIDRLTDPEPDETTPLGRVPHEKRKGNNYPIATRIGASYEE